MKSKIFNINFNIIAATLLSIVLTAFIVERVAYFMKTDVHLVISSIVVSGLIDTVVYVALHYYANSKNTKSAKRVAKDIIKIEIERVYISTPVYYIVGPVFQFFLLGINVSVFWAVIVAYSSALVLSRLAHTLYGLKSGSFRDD